jgi:hypothetical protein
LDAKPTIICIQESKLADLNFFKAQTFLPQPFSSSLVAAPAVGSRGGILTAWDPAILTKKCHFLNAYSITTSFSCNATDLDFFLTNVYGPSDHAYSNDFLQSIREVQNIVSGPWILLGDFNLVRGPADKSNGQFNASLAGAFNQAIQDILVSEIPLSDRRFTWSNNQAFPILARLDRVFTNVALDLATPLAHLSSLPKPTSDHTPLLLSLTSNIPKTESFKLDNYLLKNTNFLSYVTSAWQQAAIYNDVTGQLVARLKAARAAAKVWKRRYRAPPQILQNCKFIIHLFDYFEESRNLSSSEFQVRQQARDRLYEETRARAAYWRQRSKQKAISEGDANTSYHHAHATNRMRRKFIRLVKVNDQQIVSHAGKTQALSAFFRSIIGVPGQAAAMDLQPLFAGLPSPTSGLSREFSEAELKQAVHQMNQLSAPGPDGFGPAFFSVAWPTVRSQMLAFADAFFHGVADLERINRSYMVLLPKKQDAVDVDAFRPICLQNCALKIITKALTTRLQLEIPNLIDIHQTGFVKGRSISDTFVYALELVQTCHKRRKPAIVLKLDFAKAFDTVNWVGLNSVLQARGFDHKWIGWINSLLSSSKSAVLVNGYPGPWISCKRGLRQGDPLSPYLFILVAETLQRMITNAVEVRHPTDLNLPCAVLQYADDTLIVFKAETTAAIRLKEILDQFAAMSGLHINFAKSTLVPIHADIQLVEQCVHILGCSKGNFPQQYLGLPLSTHKLPASAFSIYIHKTDKFLASWQADLLNPMGRTVLVNSVLDSILVYLMSSLQLPASALHAMDKKRRAFLWSGDKSGTSSPAGCLVAWTKVCNPRDLGGLGVRDLGIQNICLLLKLLHRLHCPLSSAWAQWVQRRASVLTLNGDLHGDHWGTLRAIIPLYQAITSVMLGDGKCTSFWNDVWFQDEPLADRFPALLSHCNLKQASVWEIKTTGLLPTLVPRLSSTAEQELQLALPIIDQINLSAEQDKRSSPFFRPDNSLDSGALYKMIKARGQEDSPKAKFVWKSLAPPRVQLFLWLLTQRKIQCRLVLLRKGIVGSAICEICNAADESPEHIIHGCCLGRGVWTSLNLLSMISVDMNDLHSVQAHSPQPLPELPSFVALICWQIWKARNARVFRNEMKTVSQVLQECLSVASLWKHRFPARKKPVVDHWCSVLVMAREGLA